MNLILWDHMGS